MYGLKSPLNKSPVYSKLTLSEPTNTVLPSITGTTTLTASTGTWTNSPSSYAYQWKRDGVNIDGATDSTYILVTADLGTTITVSVTATNAAGSNTATSAGVLIPWTPESLTPAVWIEPSRPESTFWWDSSRTQSAVDGGLIRVVDDLSGNERHATAETDVRRPCLYLDDPVSGVPSLVSTPCSTNIAVFSYMTGTLPALGGAHTHAALVRLNEGVPSGQELFRGESGGSTMIYDWYDPPALKVRMHDGSGSLKVVTGGTNPDIRGAGWKRLICTYDGITLRGWCDGVSVGTIACGSGPVVNQYRIWQSSGAWDGELAFYAVVGRAISDDERAKLDAYLATKVTEASVEGAPTALTPNDAGGLIRAYDSTASNVLTLSGSPATPGGTCDSWAPSVGSDTLTKPSDRSAPSVVEESGLTLVSFADGGTQAIGKNLSSSTITQKTLYFVARRLVAGSPSMPLHFGTNEQTPGFQICRSTSSGLEVGGFVDATADAIFKNATHDTSWHVWAITFDGRSVRYYCDGAESGQSGLASGDPRPVGIKAAAATWSQAGFAIGYGRSTNYQAANIRVAGVWEHSTVHGPRTVRRVTEYLRGTKYPALFGAYNTDPLVVWVGASNLHGSETGIPALAAADAGNTKYDRFYMAAEGSFLSQYARSRMRQYRDYNRFTAGTRVAAVYVGGNDLAAMNLASTQASALRLFQELKTVGGFDKIVVGTQLPRTSVNDVSRASYNTWLGTLIGSTIDAVADQAGDSTIGQDGDNADTTYYSDGVHLTAAGRVIAVSYWVPAIESVL